MRAAAGATLRQLPRVALAIPPKVRRRMIVALLLAVALLSLYRFWFKDSSFVRVEHVTVTGLTTNDAPRIRLALTAAAHNMSTLDMQDGALNAAVSSFPVVKSVVARPSFPHTLKIHVIEEQPAAVLAVGGERLLLAPDGSVLRGVVTGHPLALIRSSGTVPQDTLSDRVPLSALHVAAAAPAELADRITTVTHGKQGILVHLREGPELIFGNDRRAAAKWAAIAAVLADPSSKGASYVDVRTPGRAFAGGLGADTLAPLSSTGGDTSAQSNDTTPPTGATGTTGAVAPSTPSANGQSLTTNPQVSSGP
ncbi:MAG TPA: FtsQ-type POTRA domain-containing protein [Thermoleophilaceae bacterium]